MNPEEVVRAELEAMSTLDIMTQCDIEIVNLAVTGNVVLTERVDRLIYNGKSLDAPGMGAFEVAGHKITAWRDYFDTGAS
jgi:limonene-1,2-epoxide hydrolase